MPFEFDRVIANIGTKPDLHRIANAYVVDHRRMSEEELRDAIIKTRLQYLQKENIKVQLEKAIYSDQNTDHRVISQILVRDILIEEYDFISSVRETEEKVVAFEKLLVDKSNEIKIVELSGTSGDHKRAKDFELYCFILEVAWEHENSKSPDEVNLLRKLREKLSIDEDDHRIIEAKIGKYPKPDNVLHTQSEINEVRRKLQNNGLLFPIKQDGKNLDVIPKEIAGHIRELICKELRLESYRELMQYRGIRKKQHLQDVLKHNAIPYSHYDTIEQLVDKIIKYIIPNKSIAGVSPNYGLNSKELSEWCKFLNITTSGTNQDKINRIIQHYDDIRPIIEQEEDERAIWYDYYEDFGIRNHDALRKQHLIDKDIEIELKFEDATKYLFEEKLNHNPLKQHASNHPDGLLTLQNNYLMWDNKSKLKPVNLKDHTNQFNEYMDKSDKPVPIFLVIGPDFTNESEQEAVRYHSIHMDRNIVLITAKELKELAEEWASPKNKNREKPFNLALLSVSGRYNRNRLGKLN